MWRGPGIIPRVGQRVRNEGEKQTSSLTAYTLYFATLLEPSDLAHRTNQREYQTMVIGLLVIAGIPTTVGVCQALSAQKKADNAQKEKAKFNITATVSLDGGDRYEECWCVLGAGRVSVSTAFRTGRRGGVIPSLPLPSPKQKQTHPQAA